MREIFTGIKFRGWANPRNFKHFADGPFYNISREYIYAGGDFTTFLGDLDHEMHMRCYHSVEVKYYLISVALHKCAVCLYSIFIAWG